MESSVATTLRWCPVCESRGVPIVWGEPSEYTMRLADEGRVVLAGCTPLGLHASHACTACGVEFIASDRVYRRESPSGEILGTAVWPHGRRPVRIEQNENGWTVIVRERGSMLVDPEAMPVFFTGVFADMWPWEVEEWVRRRGFDARVAQNEAGGWEIMIFDFANLFELVLIKAWWRTLGRRPVEKAIESLTSHAIWLPS